MARRDEKQQVAEQERKPRADCAVYGCGALTATREKTETGWANFCLHHYVEYHHRKSEKRVRDELGLHTVDEMKAYIRKLLKNPRPGSALAAMKKQGVFAGVEREPGQDDEEKAA